MTELKWQVLPVGSLPFASGEDAMNPTLETLDVYLCALADGEIGEKLQEHPLGNRVVWVQAIIDVH